MVSKAQFLSFAKSEIQEKYKYEIKIVKSVLDKEQTSRLCEHWNRLVIFNNKNNKMMRKMKFLVPLISVFMLFMACSKDDTADITPPGIVNNVTATPKNQSVLLNWTNPIDDDFTSTKIAYEGNTI